MSFGSSWIANYLNNLASYTNANAANAFGSVGFGRGDSGSSGSTGGTTSTTTPPALPPLPPGIISTQPTVAPANTTLLNETPGYYVYQTASGNEFWLAKGTDASNIQADLIPDGTYIAENNPNGYSNVITDVGFVSLTGTELIPRNVILTNIPVDQGNGIFVNDAVLYHNDHPNRTQRIQGTHEAIATVGSNPQNAGGRYDGVVQVGFRILNGGALPQEYAYISETITRILDFDELMNYNEADLTRLQPPITTHTGLSYAQAQSILSDLGFPYWMEAVKTGVDTITDTRDDLSQADVDALLADNPNWHITPGTPPVVVVDSVTGLTEPSQIADLEAQGWVFTQNGVETTNVTGLTYQQMQDYKAQNPNWVFTPVTITNPGDTLYNTGVTEDVKNDLLAAGWTLDNSYYLPTGNTIQLGELTQDQIDAYLADPERYPNLTSKTETITVPGGTTVTHDFKINNKQTGVWAHLIDAGDGSNTLTTDIALSTYNDSQYAVNGLHAGPGNIDNDMKVGANAHIDQYDAMYFAGDPEVRDLGGYEDGTPDDANSAEVHPDAGYYQVIAGGNSDIFSFAVNQRIQQIDVDNDPSKVAATEYGYTLNFEGDEYQITIDNGIVGVTHPDGSVERVEKGDTFQLPAGSSTPLFKIETTSVDYAGYNGAAEDRVKISFTELPDKDTYDDLVAKGFSHDEILAKASNKHEVTHGFRIPEDDADGAFGSHSGGVSNPIDKTSDGVNTYYDSQWWLCKPDEVMTHTTYDDDEIEVTTWCVDETMEHFDLSKPTTDETTVYDGVLETPIYDGELTEARFDARLTTETDVYAIEKYQYELTETIESSVWYRELRSNSPIALDLDGDGLKTVTGHAFDYDGDGDKDLGAWVESDDGVLVFDTNQDGEINDITETFGNAFAGSNSEKGSYSNGYEALIDFIQSHPNSEFNTFADDKRLTAAEADAMGIQILVNGELRSLSDFDVDYISLESTESDYVDANGVQHAVGSYYTKVGSDEEFDAVDLFFPFQNTDTSPGVTPPAVPEPTLTLANELDKEAAAANRFSDPLSAAVMNYAAGAMVNSLYSQSYGNVNVNEPSMLGNSPLSAQNALAYQNMNAMGAGFGAGFGSNSPNAYLGMMMNLMLLMMTMPMMSWQPGSYDSSTV